MALADKVLMLKEETGISTISGKKGHRRGEGFLFSEELNKTGTRADRTSAFGKFGQDENGGGIPAGAAGTGEPPMHRRSVPTTVAISTANAASAWVHSGV